MSLLRRATDAAVWWSVGGGALLVAAYSLSALLLAVALQRRTAAHALRMARYFAWPFDSALCVCVERSKSSARQREVRRRERQSPRFIELQFVESPREVEEALTPRPDDESRRSSLGSLHSLELNTPRYLSSPPSSGLATPRTTYQMLKPRTPAMMAARYMRHGLRQYNVLMVALLLPVHAVVAVVNWALVFTIPSAKLAVDSARVLWEHGRHVEPRAVAAAFTHDHNVFLYVPRAAQLHYCKYEVHGFNVAMLNCASVALFVAPMALGAWPHYQETHPLHVFVASIMCTVPLAFFVGVAIERLAEQSSASMASFLNAVVGSLVDVIFTSLAIVKGGLVDLVKANLIGSLLLCLIAFPGVAFIVSGIKHRRASADLQHINIESASIASELLLLAAFGCFTPTLFYYSFGSYASACSHCTVSNSSDTFNCAHCVYSEIYESDEDDLYTAKIRPLTHVSAALLPCVYLVSLVYTLYTHAHEVRNGSSAPKRDDVAAAAAAEPISRPWSKRTCYALLVLFVIMFGLTAVALVNVMQHSVTALRMSQQFLGITVMSLMPSVTELISTTRFAAAGKLELAVEICVNYSSQIMLLQLPFLVAVAAVARAAGNEHAKFELTFEPIDVFVILMSIFIVNQVVARGDRANYMKGALLCAVYIIIIAAYWFSVSE